MFCQEEEITSLTITPHTRPNLGPPGHAGDLAKGLPLRLVPAAPPRPPLSVTHGLCVPRRLSSEVDSPSICCAVNKCGVEVCPCFKCHWLQRRGGSFRFSRWTLVDEGWRCWKGKGKGKNLDLGPAAIWQTRWRLPSSPCAPLCTLEHAVPQPPYCNRIFCPRAPVHARSSILYPLTRCTS